jgi:hypothetical protein
MDNSEWAERKREYAQATQHEGGLYLPRTAGERVRLTASTIEFWRNVLAGHERWGMGIKLLRAAGAALRYAQWQAWREGR